MHPGSAQDPPQIRYSPTTLQLIREVQTVPEATQHQSSRESERDPNQSLKSSHTTLQLHAASTVGSMDTMQTSARNMRGILENSREVI